LLIAFALAGILASAAGCRRDAASPDVAPAGADGGASVAGQPTDESVTVKVDFSDGAQKQIAVPWRAEMTVLDAIRAAEKHPRGIACKVRFSGESAFVDAIDGLSNQGGGAGAKNWVYRVNGDFAHDSCGIHKLKPADVVLWNFGSYE
jgi:hypothetical protein